MLEIFVIKSFILLCFCFSQSAYIYIYTLVQYLNIYSLCVQGLETGTKTLQSYCVYHAKKRIHYFENIIDLLLNQS